jgi:uncharacterized protein
MRYRYFALIAFAAAMMTSLHAASFDCFKAKTSLERAICEDAELSALDEEMAAAYNAAIDRQAGYPERLIAEQVGWLKIVRKYKNRDPVALRDARIGFYLDRIEALKTFPAFPLADADPPTDAPTLAHVVDTHPDFDFTLRMVSCDANTGPGTTPDHCSGPGQIIVRKKGETVPLQVLNQPLVTDRNNEGDIALNATRDYNFDGHPDLTLQSSRSGLFDEPVFDIYLFNPRTERFVYSRAFSALTRQGALKIDKRRCRISARAEAGPGVYTAFFWRVSGNLPVLIKQEVWDTPGND